MAAKKKPAGKGATDPLALMRERFDRAMEASADNRRLFVEDMKFRAATPDNGWQWPEDVTRSRKDDPNGPRPCLTVNKTRQHVNQVVNDGRQNRPQLKALPVDDKADPEVADAIDGIFRHIQANSDADTAFDTALDCAVAGGMGYFRILTEYVDESDPENWDQEIVIKRIRNPLTVIDDPDIQDPAGRDRKFCFVTEKYTKEEYDARWGKTHPIEWEKAREAALAQWISKDSVVVAEYWCVETVESEVERDGRKRLVKQRRIKWQLVNGEKVLEEREWPGKWIPIPRVIGNEFDIEGKVHLDGLVRPMKDSQRMYNYHSSLEVEMIALAPKAPFVAAAEAVEGHEGKWNTANRVNHSYLPFNARGEDGEPLPAPQRAAPPMPSAAIIQAKLAAADDMKAVTGQYDASLGQKSNETSGVAIARRQHEGDVATFHYIDNLARALKFAGEIIIDLIPKIYDTERVLRIIGEDGAVDTITIRPGQGVPMAQERGADGKLQKVFDLSVGRYDVRVDVGPSFTTRRQEAAVNMQEMVRAAPAIMGVVGDLLVKAQDWPGADEFAERLRRTIPPEILGDDEEMENLPPQAVAMLTQAKQSVDIAKQQMAELVQGKDGLQQQAQQVEAEKAAVEAAKREFDAAQRIADAERRAWEAEQARKVTEAQMQIMQRAQQVEAQAQDVAQREAQATETEQKSAETQQTIVPALEQFGQALAMIAQGQQALMAGLERVAQIAASPRESELIDMPDGSMRARSRVLPTEVQ